MPPSSADSRSDLFEIRMEVTLFAVGVFSYGIACATTDSFAELLAGLLPGLLPGLWYFLGFGGLGCF